MRARTATEIVGALCAMRNIGEGLNAPLVLWDDLKALNCAGYFTDDVDPTPEKLAILRALPLDGLNAEHVMVALVLTEDSTPEIAAERKRLSNYVVESLGGIAIGPVRVYDTETGAGLPTATWASIDLGDDVRLSTTQRPGESNEAVAQRMMDRAQVLSERRKVQR